MLTQRSLATILAAPPSHPSQLALSDPDGRLELVEDTTASHPAVHWLVRLGGGESRAVCVRPTTRRLMSSATLERALAAA